MTDESEAFASQVGALATNMGKLADSVDQDREARRRTDRRRSLLNALILCAVLVLLVMTVKLYDVATTSEAARKQGRATQLQIQDCITPSPVPPPQGTPDTRDPKDVHECAERGGKTTQAAIETLIAKMAELLGQPIPTTTTTAFGG
jgi:general stress protein YciG